jgi:hypothetical protein
MMNEKIDAPMEVESGSEPLTDISLALRQLKPNQRLCKEREFAAHFDEIKALIEQGVSYKDVRLALAKGGLPMSAATFKKMFEAESNRCAKASSEAVNKIGDAK